jgi:hypothetical protein
MKSSYILLVDNNRLLLQKPSRNKIGSVHYYSVTVIGIKEIILELYYEIAKAID